MRCRANRLRTIASIRAFRGTEAFTALILLTIGTALQAQSDGLGSVGAQFFSPDAKLTLTASDADDGTLPAEIFRVPPYSAFRDLCATTTRCADEFVLSARSPSSPRWAALETSGDKPDHASNPPSDALAQNPKSPGLNQSIYHKNKLEFSLDGGWLPLNIPFVFDVFLGDAYNKTPLKYTLVPIIGSIRWQIDNVGGPWILRGNWDLECSGAVTFIPRGPETRYFAWIIGFRRNFVPRRGRIAPYFDGRVGLGGIDAKGPAGVLYAQGQDFTFTMNMGSGVRYNFNPRYSISAGLNWMHISNLYLSQPQFANYGINVYGPMFGIDVRLGKLRHHGSE